MERIHVHVRSQTLDLVVDGEVVTRYPISTSYAGTGSKPGSFKTPLGRFRIADKIGAGAAIRQILNGARAGEIAEEGCREDLLVTRVLWLDGQGRRNANTYGRNIHIHGTVMRAELGTPRSRGCVRMDCADIIELFERVEVGTQVWITRR
jgi:L,D-transpeptidase YbiS